MKAVHNNTNRTLILTTLTENTGNTMATTNQPYQLGSVLKDFWVRGPISPENGKEMQIAPIQVCKLRSWFIGEDLAEQMRSNVHKTARQPIGRELDAIFNALVESGCDFNGNLKKDARYWKGDILKHPFEARILDFETGKENTVVKTPPIAHVLIVRDGP